MVGIDQGFNEYFYQYNSNYICNDDPDCIYCMQRRAWLFYWWRW